MSKRKYTKRRRAEQEAATRERIAAAAAELHAETGPRDTTVSAVAARAGVQRLTVYRHFPDEVALFRACSAHWLAENPPPDPAGWRDVPDAAGRTRAALAALYAYYRRTSDMWRLAYRDRDDVPALREPMEEFERYLDDICEDLLQHWQPGDRAAAMTRAVLGHLLAYSTWRSLNGEGLSDDDMADLAVAWLRCMAAPATGAG